MGQFLRKRGAYLYLAALKKGAIRAAHPYYVIYRELPPPHQEKMGQSSYTVFFKKKKRGGGGAYRIILYLAALKKGAIRAAHP